MTHARLAFLAPLALAACSNTPPGPGAATLTPLNDTAVLAANCTTCHGVEGRGSGDIPALRGRPATQLAERMLAFKDHRVTGASATVMPLMMQGYSATQIEALAQWFAKETP